MPVSLPLLPGDPTRLGAYEVIGRLGVGGQGVVYLGRGGDTRPEGTEGRASAERHVAIKLLHAQLIGDATARSRFMRELAVAERIAGFCTAQVLDADLAGDQPYIVSEFVPGPSLQQLVTDEGPRTGATLERLAVNTATALVAIHRTGIVHRDFKPQNVLMGPDGPRVIDFGIARALDSATMTSHVLGTPAYMAPEQFSQIDIGPPADMFAWGGTMLFAATGHRPFGGDSIHVVMFRILNDTPDLTRLPARLAEVVGACLSKDPRARPTAEEVLLRLLGRDTEADAGTDRGESEGGTEPPAAPENAETVTVSFSGLPRLPRTPLDWASTDEASPSPWASPLYPGQVPQPPPGPAPRPSPGPAPRPPPVSATEGPQTARVKRFGRTPGVITALVLSVLLAILDLAALAFAMARRNLPADRMPLLLVAAIFAGLTLVAVVGVWRGSPAAAWTVVALRVARMALWAVSALSIPYVAVAIVLQTVPPAIVVVLLLHGLGGLRRGTTATSGTFKERPRSG